MMSRRNYEHSQRSAWILDGLSNESPFFRQKQKFIIEMWIKVKDDYYDDICIPHMC